MFKITADELPRFMQCNGSRLMPNTQPPIEQDTIARDEGTAAHWLATEIFKGGNVAEYIDRKAPNGIFITSEICDAVEQYLLALQPGGLMEVETSFMNVAARADHISFTNNILRIDDFKFGWRLVEPENNWTLLAHAIGWFEQAQVMPVQIILTIHQPRPHHREGRIRHWQLGPASFIRYRQELIDKLTTPSDELITGRHCRKCHALNSCPAAKASQYNAIDAAEMAFSEIPTNEELREHLEIVERAENILKARKEALQELALHRIKNGEVIQDYCAETQLGNTTWKPGITADLVKMLTNIDVTKSAIITPGQAKKLGIAEEIIKSLTHRPQTGVRLTKINADKRVKNIFKMEN